jgi:hypothetical protein
MQPLSFTLTPAPLTNASLHATWPRVVRSADGTRITVVWTGNTPDRKPPDLDVVLASSSTDSGVTWSAPTLLAAPDAFFENVELSRLEGSADGLRLIAFWSTT